MPRGGKRVEPLIRFWARVSKRETCWEWTGPYDGDGYGQFTDGEGRNVRAHRFSWSLANGPIPAGLKVLHRCDNPPCVNPSHLFLGTDNDNLKDAISKGRLNVVGENNAAAKLCDESVREIRRLCGSGVGQKVVAAKYGVHHDAIHRIVTGRSWKHVE